MSAQECVRGRVSEQVRCVDKSCGAHFCGQCFLRLERRLPNLTNLQGKALSKLSELTLVP
jgi:hypothetical protein